jgi:hypothetical protein
MFSIYKGYDKGEMAPQGNKKTLKPLKLQGFFWCAVQDSNSENKIFSNKLHQIM